MNKPKRDLSGQKFGKLTVLEFSHKDKHYTCHWKCQCECGNIKIVNGGGLNNDNIKFADVY